MKKKSLHTLLLISVLVIAFTPTSFGRCDSISQWPEGSKPARARFRYVIVENKTYTIAKSRRTLTVLLDPASFSEENLRELFALLSKRFPQPESLTAQVFTSMEQIPTPEESDLPQASEVSSNPEIGKYHWAVLVRTRSEEYFRYNPEPPQNTIKTVKVQDGN